jgi:hypothetical protein
MMTLRERKTQYGIIANLVQDHTASSVNTAVTDAFAAMQAHMKRTLTWDQGIEMARHQELTAATGVPIFFAERSSPWQRGASENYNGLARQYFPTCIDDSDGVVGSAAVASRRTPGGLTRVLSAALAGSPWVCRPPGARSRLDSTEA